MGRQISMVIDLNKCIGCQSCTVACKTLWTSGEGQEHMLFNNVETKPGPGYPKNWEAVNGGFKNGELQLPPLIDKEDYGGEKPLNFQDVYFDGKSDRLQQTEAMGYGSNWDEDTSSGTYPNNYHFYLPRLCNH
ncbi:MAG: respiratory nitrate reductase subunit beta, partial [Gammaproteobacteria bacterium]|nr:respiratory nitrate reductase subunit beta [Gammaproteobacteria bacterium]